MQDLPSYSGPDGYPSGGMVSGSNMVGGPFTTMEVRLMRQVSGFGFRIIGGEEEGSQVQLYDTLWFCVFCGYFDF